MGAIQTLILVAAALSALDAAPAWAVGTLGCDQVVSDEITVAGEVDVFELFDVTDGEMVNVHVDLIPFLGSTLDPQWRLLDSSGVEAAGCGGAQKGRRDCGPLPSSGNPYRVEVSGPGTGDYRVHAQALSAAGLCANAQIPDLGCDETLDTTGSQPYVLGHDLGTSIEYRVDSDIIPLAFTTGTNEIIAVNVARVSADPMFGEATFDPRWRLLDATGHGVSGCDGEVNGRRDCGPLPVSGNPYAVEIFDGGGDGIGHYRAHVQRLTATKSCDGSGDCRIDGAVDTDLFAFTVATPTTVSIDVLPNTPSDPTFDARWRVLDRSGAPVSGCGPAIPGPLDCGPLDPVGSPYRVEVFDQQSDGTGIYRVDIANAQSACQCGSPCLPVTNCGNGMIDGNELCDEGAATGTVDSCCTADCTIREAGQICRRSTTFCDAVERCSGQGGACPADEFLPDETPCNFQSPCTVKDQCDDGQCVPGITVCDVAFQQTPGKPRVGVRCSAQRTEGLRACVIRGFTQIASGAPAVESSLDAGLEPPCNGDLSAHVLVVKRVKKRLKKVQASSDLQRSFVAKLNPFGRKLYEKAVGALPVTFCATLVGPGRENDLSSTVLLQ